LIDSSNSQRFFYGCPLGGPSLTWSDLQEKIAQLNKPKIVVAVATAAAVAVVVM